MIKNLISDEYCLDHTASNTTKVMRYAESYISKKSAKIAVNQMITKSEETMWLEIVTVYTN